MKHKLLNWAVWTLSQTLALNFLLPKSVVIINRKLLKDLVDETSSLEYKRMQKTDSHVVLNLVRK